MSGVQENGISVASGPCLLVFRGKMMEEFQSCTSESVILDWKVACKHW